MKALGSRWGPFAYRRTLTLQQVDEIRMRSTGGWGQQAALAEEYGVAPSTISRIIGRRRWAK